MKRFVFTVFFIIGLCPEVQPHNPGSIPVTWNREISRIIYNRCASCHRDGGTAFSLMTYPDAQPRADAIKQAVLSRRMPPWGAVKGFGDFRNDQGLSQDELELITDWVEGGLARGNNPNVLPKPPKFSKTSQLKIPKDAVVVSGNLTLERPIVLDGLVPKKVPDGTSLEIVGTLPDGSMEPLIWLYEYKDSYQHPFWFREAIDLPAGTVIRGVPSDAQIVLIPGKKKKTR
jgi:hypothetical protein